jgi:hypothetical protein
MLHLNEQKIGHNGQVISSIPLDGKDTTGLESSYETAACPFLRLNAYDFGLIKWTTILFHSGMDIQISATLTTPEWTYKYQPR